MEETLNPSSMKSAGPVEGAMFLYERPELLTVEDHAGPGLSAVARHRLFGPGNRSCGVDRVR